MPEEAQRRPDDSVHPAEIPAIVLSCNRYHPFAQHMINAYRALWPDCPFRFHVPFQPGTELALDDWIFTDPDVETRATPESIKETVLTLVQDMRDEQWVYWCIDDKYPIAIDIDVLRQTCDWIFTLPSSVVGITLCRARKLLDPHYLREGVFELSPWGERFLARATYRQFWFHSFLRVGFLRRTFGFFPAELDFAKQMDDLLHLDCGSERRIPSSEMFLVSEGNHMILGESTTRGQITRNARDSFLSKGLPLPGNALAEAWVIMGGNT